MRNSLILLISVLLVSGACKRLTHKDLSLTVNEYQKLGMPDPGKPWSIRNYVDAQIRLSSFKIYNPKSLPRKHSKRSGTFFSHFVNKEVLLFWDDPKIPLTTKAMAIQNFARLQNDLIGMYSYTSDSVQYVQYYNEELPDIYIFTIWVQDKKMEIAGKIVNSKKEADINYQYGLTSVLYNYLNIIKVIMGEQVKPEVYRLKDLERLSMEVTRSLTQNYELILPADREILASQIQIILEKSPSKSIKTNYRKALNAFNDTKK